MTILVTGSSGHLGDGLMRTLAASNRPARGIDIRPGAYTDRVGSITDRALVRDALVDARAVVHTATLHKPHVATHDRQAFVDTNIAGTLALLEEAVAAGVEAFVFTSTTSAFGDSLSPPDGAPAAWIDEDAPDLPKNIYGVTKSAAEDLCRLFHRRFGLHLVVLRTSRFFPEEDDSAAMRARYADANLKANEFLFRRVDLADAVAAHLAALARAPALGWGRYVISATTPFRPADLVRLRHGAPAVVAERVPAFAEVYDALGFAMFPGIDRVYSNARARRDLAWRPQYDFARVLGQLARGEAIGSPLAQAVGRKGYHDERFETGPYPVE